MSTSKPAAKGKTGRSKIAAPTPARVTALPKRCGVIVNSAPASRCGKYYPAKTITTVKILGRGFSRRHADENPAFQAPGRLFE
ncbi:MAG: hypothetical protein ONB48_19490 [candidate division KSB1 bacterium]|nr:hypothetical protein [candidate division KSB1 bacterium]MDZ7287830.1 hypothetical protein [candidate division KSB1 bacterium]MDZ7296724.1 hypothetical protein [candidate division KSB1 bacterium]MDZ7307714.1 hypothetical protein [candidate division KSB1 bacterium]MDZ7347590.1 hypothetical protein [candidate division KSB1 bacterium]